MNTVKPESVGLSAARLARIEGMVRRYMERGLLAGAITVLMRRGEVAHYNVVGEMDIAAGKPLREDTIFRIFSLTKPITTLAALMLYEENAFHLQHPAAMFLPEFKDLRVFVRKTTDGMELAPLARPVTIFDLLTHTSGLGYGLDAATEVNAMYQQAAMLRMDESMADKIGRMVQLPLHHQPGERFTYSLGVDVVGRIIEIISGKPLDAFLKERIFEPLGMVDTDFFVPPEKLDRLAVLYSSYPEGGLVDISVVPGDPCQFPFGLWNDKSIKPAFLSGGGGLVSTTGDMLRFVKMLRNGGTLDGVRLVSRKTIELMTSPHLRPDQGMMSGTSAGLGFTVITDPAQALMLGSPGAYGASGAANTEFFIDPREDMLGLMMMQYVHYAPPPFGMDFHVLAAQAIED